MTPSSIHPLRTLLSANEILDFTQKEAVSLLSVSICHNSPSLKPAWPTHVPKQLSANWPESKILSFLLARLFLIPPNLKTILVPFWSFSWVFSLLCSALFMPFGSMTEWPNWVSLVWTSASSLLSKDLNTYSLHCAASSAPGWPREGSMPSLPLDITELKCLTKILGARYILEFRNWGTLSR